MKREPGAFMLRSVLAWTFACGEVSVRGASRAFGVEMTTARRHFKALEQDGLLDTRSEVRRGPRCHMREKRYSVSTAGREALIARACELIREAA